ncbi:MAG: hypothetical protein DRQ61_11315, partial [Gammaproteobacteria bacterium]
MTKPHALSLKWVSMGWLLFVLTVSSLAIKQNPSFDSSILALLPKQTQQPIIQQATEKMAERFSKRLIIMLSGEDEEKVRLAVKTLAEGLANTANVSSVTWHIEDGAIERLQLEQFPYRFVVINKEIRARLLAGNYDEIKSLALTKLYSPLSVKSGSITEDPFRLFSELALHQNKGLNLQVNRSLLKVSGVETPTYILMVALSGEPFSTQLQQNVLGEVERNNRVLKESGIKLSMSGMLLHASAGAQQAKSEISTIGVGSLLCIVAMMLLVFRRLKPLLLTVLPVVVGCVTAAALT